MLAEALLTPRSAWPADPPCPATPVSLSSCSRRCDFSLSPSFLSPPDIPPRSSSPPPKHCPPMPTLSPF